MCGVRVAWTIWDHGCLFPETRLCSLKTGGRSILLPLFEMFFLYILRVCIYGGYAATAALCSVVNSDVLLHAHSNYHSHLSLHHMSNHLQLLYRVMQVVKLVSWLLKHHIH